MYRKFLAVLMTVCLVATLFAGCGSKGKDEPSASPSGAPSSDNGTAAGADAALPGHTQNVDDPDGTGLTNGSDGNTANTQGGSDRPAQKPSGGGSSSTTRPSGGGSTTTTKPSGGGSTTTTKPSGGGSTTTTKPSGGGSQTNDKAEILSYFNTAANKVKTGKPKLTYQISLSMNVMGQSFDDSDQGSVNKGNSLNDAFPVSGKTWASQLSASAVKSATRTLKDGRYTIKIVLNTEKGVKNIQNSAHSKVFTTMDLNDMNDAVQDEDIQIKNVSNTFHDSSITCVVEKNTGNMLSATYLLNDDISATIASEGMEIPAIIKMKMNTGYTMAW